MPVLNENLSQNKYENVNTVNYNFSLIALTVIILGIYNNSSKHVASEENFVQGVGMRNLVSNRWVDMLEEETFNSDFDGHDDHDFVGVKLDSMVTDGLKVQGFHFSLFGLHLTVAGSCLLGLQPPNAGGV